MPGHILPTCRRRDNRWQAQFMIRGIARQHLAIQVADFANDIRLVGDAFRKRCRLIAHEGAVHDEQLLEWRGRGLAVGAVHGGFGEAIELQQIVEPAATDASVDGAAIIPELIEVGRRAAGAGDRDCRPLAGCSRDRPRCRGGAGSCARADDWRDRFSWPRRAGGWPVDRRPRA